MSYLTRLRIGLSQAAECELRDGYAWHAALWHAFPGRDGQSQPFLFRIDRRGDLVECLMLSDPEPKPQHWGAWEVKTVVPDFLEHSRYRFQIRANPTMRRSSDGRRLGIYGEDRLRAWLHRKADAAGFAVGNGSLVVGAPIDETFVKNGRRGKHVSVDFQGLLEVKDREAFRTAFANGIGSAKAFGYGLLMLQPIPR